MAQTVKNLPEMQEIWVQSLGQEDPLEEEMATLASIKDRGAGCDAVQRVENNQMLLSN